MKHLLVLGFFALIGCSNSDNDTLMPDEPVTTSGVGESPIEPVGENSTPVNAGLSNDGIVSKYGVFSLRRGSGALDPGFTLSPHAAFDGAYGVFYQSNGEVSRDDILNLYTIPLDTCITFDSPDDSFFIGASSIRRYGQIDGERLTNIRAGDVLTLSSNAGSWLDVTQGPAPNYFYKDFNVPLIDPASTDLNISIPGDQFSAFIETPIPDVDRIVVTAPDEGSITQLDTVFTWESSSISSIDRSYVRFTAQKLIGSRINYVDCMAIDDGEFNIPEQYQAELGELFKDYSFAFNRTSYSLTFSGDSGFLIMNSMGSM